MKLFACPIIFFFSVIYTTAVSASDFKSGVCSNDEFLECVGATKARCENSYSQSEKDCMKKYPIDTDNENEELYKLAKKYGQCSTARFISGLGIKENKFEECGEHLEPTFTEYRKNAEKAHKLNEERLRKLEELQYQ